MGHDKKHPLTGNTDHDLTGLASGEVLIINNVGDSIAGSKDIVIDSFSATTVSGGTIYSGSTDVGTLLGGGGSLWSSSGSNIYYTSGNVGIGTSNPLNPLYIEGEGTTSATSPIKIVNGDTTPDNLLEITDDGRISIGLNSSFSLDNDLAIGTNSTANGVGGGGATAVGKDADATAVFDVAIGAGATASGSLSVAISDASASGLRSIAIGNNARATTIRSIAIQDQAWVTGNYGIAFGFNTKVTAAQSWVFGIGLTGVVENDISDSGIFAWRTNPTFFFNNDGALVIKNETRLTADTHFDSSATNTITIHSGTSPTTTITEAVQFYGAVVSGNTAPHFRVGTDTINLHKGNALTTADTSTVDATYGTEEADVINNLRTRVNELESLIQSLGLL